jgi:hypothetical protein
MIKSEQSAARLETTLQSVLCLCYAVKPSADQRWRQGFATDLFFPCINHKNPVCFPVLPGDPKPFGIESTTCQGGMGSILTAVLCIRNGYPHPPGQFPGSFSSYANPRDSGPKSLPLNKLSVITAAKDTTQYTGAEQ